MFGSSSDQQLNIVIKARDEATQVFEKVDGSLKKMGGGFAAATSASTKLAIGIGGLAVAAGSFGVMAVKAAGQAEKEMARFAATLETMGPKGKAAEAGILAAARAAVKLGFDDEEAANSIASLFQRTGDLTKALELNRLAMDLSRAKGIDLAEANKMISLVMSGNARALKLYGIEIDDTLGPMAALEQLQQRVSGQAEGFSKTFEGQIATFRIEFQNFLEVVGTHLLPILTKVLQAINPIIEKLALWAADTAVLVDWLKKHQAILIIIAGAITGALIPAFIALATTILTVVIPAILAGALALAPFIIGGAVIAGIGLGVMWIIKHWDMLKAKAYELWQAVPQPFREGAELLIDLAERITRAYIKMVDTISGAFGKIKGAANTFLPGLGGNLVGTATKAALMALPLPKFEKGGIVPGPVGTPVPIMAHGQERVIPANQVDRDPQPITIHLNFNAAVVGNDGMSQVVKAVQMALDRSTTLKLVGGV